MARQPYQAMSDMFGQLIPSNEPFLSLYLPGSFSVDAPGVDEPILPLAKYIENVKVKNLAAPSPSISALPRSICRGARQSAAAVRWFRRISTRLPASR